MKGSQPTAEQKVEEIRQRPENKKCFDCTEKVSLLLNHAGHYISSDRLWDICMLALFRYSQRDVSQSEGHWTV